jgi:benzoyl-CoA reductase subunit C
MTAGLMIKRDEYNTMLKQTLAECQNAPDAAKQKRLMIIGPLLDNIDLLRTIESFGACIVTDEITNGWRYFDQNVQIDGDLCENLAARYLQAGPSPTLNTDPQSMLASFRGKVSKLDLDGVIYINQKFCEPHIHHYMAKSDILKDMNINCLLLEIEHGTQKISERDLLRIESFIEVI